MHESANTARGKKERKLYLDMYGRKEGKIGGNREIKYGKERFDDVHT